MFIGLTKTISATSSIEYGLDLYPYGCIGYPSSSIIKLKYITNIDDFIRNFWQNRVSSVMAGEQQGFLPQYFLPRIPVEEEIASQPAPQVPPTTREAEDARYQAILAESMRAYEEEENNQHQDGMR